MSLSAILALILATVVAMEFGGASEDLARICHAHPTLSETVMESAESVYGQSTHVYKRK